MPEAILPTPQGPTGPRSYPSLPLTLFLPLPLPLPLTQVTYQAKIFFTAIFSVCLLGEPPCQTSRRPFPCPCP